MTADNELGSDDGRTLEQVRYDAMSDKVHDAAETVLELSKLVKELAHGGTTNTVIHKTEGMGAVGIVCAVVSVCCFLMMAGMGWLIATEFGKQNSELHDLHAWKDVHSNDIAMLKAKIGQQK